jgi:phenylpropionate dioxygenase-like ring-hydroxylating dioxygenase large terminal subunit
MLPITQPRVNAEAVPLRSADPPTRKLPTSTPVSKWNDVLSSEELGAIPRRVVVDGREIVLWRLPDGGVGALDDRCAHQAMRLSIGTALPDGCLVCVAHGWTYRSDGSNALIPGGPGVKSHQAHDDGVVIRVRLSR